MRKKGWKGLSLKERKALLLYVDSGDKRFFDNARACAREAYQPKSQDMEKYYASRVKRTLQEVITDKELQKHMDPVLRGSLTSDWIVTNIMRIAMDGKRDGDRLRALELLGRFKEMQIFKEVPENVEVKVGSEADLDAHYRDLIGKKEKTAKIAELVADTSAEEVIAKGDE